MLYAWLHGRAGLKVSTWFFLKWSSTTLLKILFPISLAIVTSTVLHLLLSVIILVKPLFTNPRVKVSEFAKPFYEWLDETYLHVVRYVVNLFTQKCDVDMKEWVEWVIYNSPMNDNIYLMDLCTMLMAALCLCVLTLVSLALLAILERIADHYTKK